MRLLFFPISLVRAHLEPLLLNFFAGITIALLSSSLLFSATTLLWHPIIGEDYATSGSFISTFSCDDPTYTTFYIRPSDDGPLFDLQNGHELIVKSGQNLSSGSYQIDLVATDGTTPYYNRFVIEVVPGKNRPVIEGRFGYYTLFLTAQGELFTSGWNSHGSLGINSTTNYNTPQQIDASTYGNKIIVEIDSAITTASMITSDGMVYVWGSSAGRASGTSGHAMIPTAVPPSALGGLRIVKTSTAIGHIAFLTDQGTVYMTGESTSYRGDDPTNISINNPNAVDQSGIMSGKFIVEIVCVSPGEYLHARFRSSPLWLWKESIWRTWTGRHQCT